ncbi:hypothetical protein [Janthinobacterium sp. 17J80-10]|uniref:hypothetical protein n=1 Tax=Janthinobacterium sp. 17J80-10 TaxID=2497863 RepID=UPI0010056A3D|nr:hypothetical protein [Janthinobacterium sp. 17J80-10]QAU33123.1 hypothetical protein EKL02_02425 [Janthinobacterium sp. 17J80-10]
MAHPFAVAMHQSVIGTPDSVFVSIVTFKHARLMLLCVGLIKKFRIPHITIQASLTCLMHVDSFAIVRIRAFQQASKEVALSSCLASRYGRDFFLRPANDNHNNAGQGVRAVEF